MQKIITLIFFILSGSLFTLKAQKAVQDSSTTIPAISAHYSYDFASGDLTQRFGNFHNVGADFILKLKSNFLLGIDAGILFGSQVKNEEDYFKRIRNDHGYVIDGNGQCAEVYLSMRGFQVYVFTGYQFHFLSPNPNSGPFIQAGVGLLQHQVKIDNPGNVTPQITGEYAKLYDRLSNGLSLTQTLGYRFFGNRNLTNFYFGLEISEAWTQSRRSWNADDMRQNTDTHLDIIYGIKLGWTIPLYGRAPRDFYYY